MSAHFYVYEHWRPDTGTIFYVGKGHGRRAFQMRGAGRSRWHRFIVEKLHAAGLTVDVRIIHSDLDEGQAFAKEVGLIAEWRASGAPLANMTDGGEGASGAIVSEATRHLISARSKGRKLNAEVRARMSAAAMGNKRAYGYKRKPHEIALIVARSTGRVASAMTREKQRLAKLGLTLSVEHKENIKRSVAIAYSSEETRAKCAPSLATIEKGRQANIGKKQSAEHIAKKVVAVLGRKNTEETKQLMRQRALEREARKRAMRILAEVQE